MNTPGKCSKTEKGNRVYADWEKKFSLFSDNLLEYIENPKEWTKWLLKIMSSYTKTEGYKVDILKYAIFLYSNNELSGRDSRKTVLFNDASKWIKYLRINLLSQRSEKPILWKF